MESAMSRWLSKIRIWPLKTRRRLREKTEEKMHRFLVAVNWSALSGIGNSSVARLTILVPIVGYLIIFNTSLVGYFDTVLPERPLPPGDWLEAMYEKNLKFLYFGLLVFGIGVSLYTLAVPPQIRRFPRVEVYIVAMEGIGTRNLTIGSFENIIGMYFNSLGGEERSPAFEQRSAAFPSDVSNDLHRLVEAMFVAAEFEDSEVEFEKDLVPRFYTGSGYVITDEILETMYSGRRVDRNLQYALYHEAEERSKDVYYIEHRATEYSKPKTRVLVFILFLSGLILTALPTVLTSALILRNW